MRVRVSPIMTLAAIPALATLIALGVWQLQRAQEKRAALAAYETFAAQDPAAFDEVYCDIARGLPGRPVAPLENPRGQIVRFYGARADGQPGWRLLRLAPAPVCVEGEAPAHVFVQTGFETLRGAVTGPAARYVLAPPPRANLFTPQNATAENVFYRFDARAMSEVAGVAGADPRADLWLGPADRPPPDIADMPPSRHFGYAMTWFGLALTLVGVYVAYHLRVGRSERNH